MPFIQNASNAKKNKSNEKEKYYYDQIQKKNNIKNWRYEMTVTAEKAIQFECEKCGRIQFTEYTLTHAWYEDRAINEDNIMCEKCNHDNHVIEEL